MASKKTLNERIRSRYMKAVADFFSDKGEEILVTGSNEICLPCLNDEGDDEFIVITFKVPTGSREGDAYDGYSMAEDYAMRQKEKQEKAAIAAKKKAEKIERDKAARAQKAKAKAEHLAKAEG